MSQYFNAIIELVGRPTKIDSFYEGELVAPTLTGQSWWDYPFVNAICALLYKQPHRIAWVGEYAYHFKFYDVAWGDFSSWTALNLGEDQISLEGKYLCNHTLCKYVDCDEYFEKSKIGKNCLHPLPLLSSVGNCKCGGDYRSDIEKDLIGSWSWDIISIEDKIPEGFVKVDCCFKDGKL